MKETPSAFQDLLDFFEEIEQDTSLTPTRSVSSESDVNSLPSTAASAVISTPVSSRAEPAVPATPAPTTTTPTSTTSVSTTDASNPQVMHARLATSTVDDDMDLEHIFDDVHQLLDQLLPQDYEVELPPQSSREAPTATTTQQATQASSDINATGASNTQNPSYTAAPGTHAGVGNAAYNLPPTLTSWYEDDVEFTPSTINPTTNWEASTDFPLSYADMIPDEQDFLTENSSNPVTPSAAATEATVTVPTNATNDSTTASATPAPKTAKTTKKSRTKTSSAEQQAQADYYASLRALLRDSSELQPMGLSSKDQLSTLLEVLSQAKSPIDDHIDYHHLAAQDWEKIRATYTLNEAEIADLEAASSCGSFDYDGELNNKFQFIMANNEPLINQAFADELSSVAEEQLLLQAQQEHYSSSNKLLAQTTNVSAHGAYINISDSALSGKIVTTEQLEVPATQVAQVNETTAEATSSETTPDNKTTKSKRKARSTTHLTPNGNSLTIHQIPVSAPGTPAPQSNPEVVWHVDLFRHEVNAPAPSNTADANQAASQSAPATTLESSNTANVVMHSVFEQPAKISQAQAAAFPDFNPFAEELFQENKFTSNKVATQNNQIEGIAELLGEKPVPEQARTPRTATATSTSSLTGSYTTSSANASGEQGIFDDLPLTAAELEQARKQQERDTLQAASILSSLGFNIQTTPASTSNATPAEPTAPAANTPATTVTGTSSSASSTTSVTSKPSKKPTVDKAQVLHDAEGHEFYSQYTYESDELDQSLELPVLASDAKLPSALLGTQANIEKPTDVRPLENFGLCLRFEIDYRQYIDSFKSPENEAVITCVLQRLQLPMPACLLLTGEEGASLERKVTRALYDYIVQARKRNDGSYLSKATTFYMDLERLIHSNKPLSFFTSHPEEADIVIINNIQLCLNSDLWQARLVEIINYCMRNKRILVLTSALSKSELTEKLYGLNIMQDLNSRLQFFINLKFERLTGKYLTNYLQGRCVNQGTPLPSSTINYLANIIQVDRSVDIDMTAFRIFKFGVLRNFDTNKLSKYIIMKNEKAFIGRHLLTNKYVTDQELSIALFRRLDKLKYFDDRAGEYGDVWQELRQQYLAELDLNDDAVVTA